MIRAKQKLLKRPLATSLTSTMSRSPEKNAWNGTPIRLFASAMTAPPNQPTRMANTTSSGSAMAIASIRGRTR